MKKFGDHYPIGVIRCKRGLPLVHEQKALLEAEGVTHLFQLDDCEIKDVMLPFSRRITGTDKPEPTVMVSPFPAVIGVALADIFEGLKEHGQPLYDLELDRFVNVEGGADAVFILRAGRKAIAAGARQVKAEAGIKGGRPPTVTGAALKRAAKDWCDPAQLTTSNDAMGAKVGVTGQALANRFGQRRECIAAGKPIIEGWNT